MADLVRYRVAVIATPGSSGSGLSQLADQFTPLETRAVMRDNEFIVA